MQRGRCNSRRVLCNCTVGALLIAAVASCDLRSQSFAVPLTPPVAAAAQAAAPSAVPAPPTPPLPLDHIDLAWTTSLLDDQAVSGFAWHDAFLLSGPAGLRAFDVITGSERFRRGTSLNGGYELGRWVASPIGHVQDIERGTPGPRLECPGDNSVRGCEIATAIASGARIFAAARATGPGPATCMVFALEDERLTRLWNRALDLDCRLSMSSNGGQLFVASERQIIALDSGNGRELWRADANFQQANRVHGDLLIQATVSNVKLSREACVHSDPVVLVPDTRTDAYVVELVIKAREWCSER